MSTQEIYEELSDVWGRTALNTQQLKLGLSSSDAAGPALVENWGHFVKKVILLTRTSILFTT